MSLWNIGSWADLLFSSANSKASRTRSKSRAPRMRRGRPLLFETLEHRQMLSVNLATINDVPLTSSHSVLVPLTGSGTGNDSGPINYTFTSSNPNVSLALVSPTSKSLKLHIEATAGPGQGADQTFSGDLILHLFEDLAPNTTARIEELVNQNYYDGLDFFRVLDGFVAQGGRKDTSPSTQQLDDEFNTSLTFRSRGLLAMAKADDDTGTAEFFITAIDSIGLKTPIEFGAMPKNLTFQHTIFGQLVSGFDLFEQIMSTPVQDIVTDPSNNTTEHSDPIATIKITSATIINDTQDAVLRVTAPATFTPAGNATITVTATGSGGATMQQTFHANAEVDSFVDPPFLATSVLNQTALTNHSVQFGLSAVNPSGGATFFASGLADAAADSSKASISVDPTTGQVTITPTAGFTGTVTFVVGVRGGTANSSTSDFDKETFSVTWATDPTLRTVSGKVFVDNNGNGVRDTGEVLLPGIVMTISGVDVNNVAVASQTVTTGADGSYAFTEVKPGTYTIRENQVASLADGTAKAGTLGGTPATNSISGIVVGATDGTGYDFTDGKLPSPKITLNLFLASTPPQTQSYSSAVSTSSGLTVLSINRASNTPTILSSVSYTVTFNKAVTGVDASDFNIFTTGNLSGTSLTVTPVSGSVYTVTVNTGTGSGTFALRLVDDDSIADASGNKLGGAGNGNGAFVGQFYSVNRQAAVQITSAPGINNQNETALVVSGKGDPGGTVTVTVTDQSGKSVTSDPATVQANGTWQTGPMDAHDLANTQGDAGITYKATQVDSVGVTTTDVATALKDDEEDPPTVTAGSIPAIISQSNINGITAAGTTTDANATIKIEVRKVGAPDNILQTYMGFSNGSGDAPFAWSVPLNNLGALPQGDLEFTITAIDAALSQASAPVIASTKDTFVKMDFDVTTPTGATINAAQSHTVTVSGTTSEGTQPFNLTVSDGDATTGDVVVPVTPDANGNWTANNVDVSTLKDGTLTFAASITDIHTNTANKSVTRTLDTIINAAITPVPSPINVTNQTSVTVSGTSDGTTVALEIVDSATPAHHKSVVNIPVTSGSWSTVVDFSSLADGALTITATATDAAGNTKSVLSSVTKQTVSITSASAINSANAGNYTVSGTGQTGLTVNLSITDGVAAHTVTGSATISGGIWSIGNLNVSGLNDGQLTITATASTATNTKTVTKDATPPTGSINTVPPVTLANQAALIVSGVGETFQNATVVVTVTDTDNTPVHSDPLTVTNATGAWMTNNSDLILDVSPLKDGTLTITATITDAAGHVTNLGPTTTQKHTVQINSIASPINNSTASSVMVSGVGQEGATVTVEVDHGADTPVTSSTATVTGGNWSVPVDVSSLTDGTLTFKATADDGAAPTPHKGTFTKTAVKDTVAPNSLTTTPAGVTAANAASYSLSGTTEANASIVLVIKDSDNGTADVPVPAFAADSGGAWSVNNIDLSSLTDGALTFSFTVSDAALNSAVFVKSGTKGP